MFLYKRCRCAERTCRHRFQYRFELHGREHRGSTRTANAQLAERAAARAYTEALEGGSAAPVKKVRLSAAVDAYVAHAKKKQRSAEKTERVLTQFLAFVRDRPLGDVSTFLIEKWKLDRAKSTGPSTVNRELTALKGFLRRCVEWKYLRESPAAAVRKYRTDDIRIRVLTDDEIKTVLTKTPEEIALLCRATLECLPRLSELLALRREHIGASWIEVRRKGGRVERVDVTAELRAALLARAHPNGFVFVGRSGQPPTQESVSSYITRVIRRLGLPGLSHQTMRHTGVTLMLEAGVNPRVIQKLAGWTSLRMLERYGHARDAEGRRAVITMHARLDQALASGPDRYEGSAQKPAHS